MKETTFRRGPGNAVKDSAPCRFPRYKSLRDSLGEIGIWFFLPVAPDGALHVFRDELLGLAPQATCRNPYRGSPAKKGTQHSFHDEIAL